jgi:hypothetical protein
MSKFKKEVLISADWKRISHRKCAECEHAEKIDEDI